eukprot:366561-Chlamydomonas_euryale.AAC.17
MGGRVSLAIAELGHCAPSRMQSTSPTGQVLWPAQRSNAPPSNPCSWPVGGRPVAGRQSTAQMQSLRQRGF